MQPIVAPIGNGDSGPQVENLQDALRLLLDRGVIRSLDPGHPTAEELAKLGQRLSAERAQSTYGEATQRLVLYIQLQEGLGDGLRGNVDSKTAERLNKILKSLGAFDAVDEYVVRGKVQDSDGKPMPEVIVRAVDRDLRRRQPLGEVRASEAGYEIRYVPRRFVHAEADGPDLQVQVFDAAAPDRLLAESAVVFNAGRETTVDLTVATVVQRPSAFESQRATVVPLLTGQADDGRDLGLADLTDPDIEFIGAETGLDRSLVAALADSARCNKEVALVEHEEFYGLLRQGLPANLDALLRLDTDALKRALARSARENIVRPLSNKDLEAFAGRIDELKAARALRPASANDPASLGDLLSVALENTDKRHFIARLFVAHGGTTDRFWTAVAETDGVEPSDVDALKRTFAFGGATGNYLPLVQAMNDLGKRDDSFAELRGFAQWDLADWRKFLAQPRNPGETASTPIGFPPSETSVEAYARKLDGHVAQAYPTAVLANRLARDAHDENPFSATRGDLLKFFAHNPAFSFSDTALPQFLSTDAKEKLRDIDDPDALRRELVTMQRLFNITRRYEEMRAFRADEIVSATAMVHLGKRKFIDRYKRQLGGEERAGDVFNRAERSHAVALNMYMSRSNAFNSPTPYVIFGDAVARLRNYEGPHVAAYARNALPDYTTLFGSLDLCDCEHCLSLYSPAAYFVDVLRFLGDVPAYKERTPLQALLDGTWGEGRRPDLEHIELTCENTHTELPYVDLTNELLEAAVVPRSFEIPELPGFNAALAALRAGQLSPWLQTALAQQFYEVSSAASVRSDVVNGTASSTQWIILDRGWAFTVRYQGTNEGFRVWSWPQTSRTSAEIMATPEHVHQPAYDVLQAAVYPWHLPFNLPLEEARGYLRHLGVPRHRLMESFFAGTLADALQDRAIAIEYLGLSLQEADVISGATSGGPGASSGPWDFWGLRETGNDIADRAHGMAPPAQGDWDVVLQRVSIFLQQSGLGYRELLELLEIYFVNPKSSAGTSGGRLLGIVSTNASDPATCELSQLAIQVIDAQVTDKKRALQAASKRAPRFVRLARRLGWSWRDLDKALANEPTGANGEVALDDTLLKKLSQIQRVQARTGLPIVTLLAWWADIDTRDYVNHLATEQTKVASLYAQLFSNKTVAGQSVGDDPSSLTGMLLAKSAAISAALQVSAADFALLQAKVPNDGAMNLANLSLLFRHATLARALKLSVRAYLTTLDLTGDTPFATPAATLQFIQKAERIQDSGFRIEELDYLLRDQSSAAAPIGPDDAALAQVLDALRSDLRKVASENTFVAAGVDDKAATSDPNGELTRRKLALLKWDAAVIDQAIAVLNDTCRYQVTLTVLAQGIVFPDSLAARISYDTATQTLSFLGTMSAAELAQLTGLPNANAAFTAAVGELFRAPKAFVTRYLARFSVPVYSVPVTSQNLRQLLASLKFPDALKDRVFYDATSQALRSVGAMTDDTRAMLTALSANNDYRALIATLFDAPIANTPTGVDVFLTSTDAANDADALFDDAAVRPPARFLRVLAKLLPYLLTTLSESAVKQRLTDYLDLDSASVDGLLMRWIRPRVVDAQHPEYRAMADFLDSSFASASLNIDTRADVFPRQFLALRLQFKIALLAQRFRLSSRQLRWLFELTPAAGWLDLNALPLGNAAPATSLYPAWERLSDFVQLRDRLPRGELLLDSVFAAARTNGAQLDAVLRLLVDGTQWDEAELRFLCSASGFNLAVNAFADEAALLRLYDAFSVLKRLGASASQCAAWRARTPTADDARELKSLVRAHYDDEQWVDLAKGLRDPLREQQRTALVGYLVQKLSMRDSNQLFEYLLIDVEMSPCMTTTRIRQAINSAQLFIQRSLMNLEPDVRLADTEVRQWTAWRKWYRVWEANRKVLFYPENWLQPELRDDKSPFYTELEGDLLQNALTSDIAEDAFQHYLEKLDQVALLDIVGVYRQQEPKEVLHVFGRTSDDPHIHFYRRLEDKVWSPWEKVDLDIDSDHLIPVVWNRRLYLFWAVFAEKSEMPGAELRAQNQEPNRYWEIKLAWSTYRNGAWSPRKLSRQFLRRNKYPFLPEDAIQVPPLVVAQDPRDFSFKSRTLPTGDGGQLSIECYGPIVEPVRLDPPPPPPPPAVVTRQPATSFNPHTVFDIGKWSNVPTSTYLKCRVLVGGRAPTATERATMSIDLRASNNARLESRSLNANGNGYSAMAYTSTLVVELVSSAFDLDGVTEDGSWWMPFNPGGYASFVVGFGFDAVADAQAALGLPDIGQVTKDVAIAAAIAAAVATAGNPGAIVAAATTAVTVVSAPAATVFSAACFTVLGRLFGRGFTVKVKARIPQGKRI